MSISDFFKKDGEFLLAPTLHIYASDHCTKCCESCTTSSPHRRAHFGDAEKFTKYINLLYDNHVKVGNINITGGEPFAHKNLEQFIKTLRSGMKYHVPFLVTSNGFWIDDADQYPSGLAKGDGVMISRYPDIIFSCGGLAHYEALINRLKATQPNPIIQQNAIFFREWTFTNVPHYGYPQDCGLAKNLTVSNSGIFYKCCVAPGALFQSENDARVQRAFWSASNQFG